MPAKARRAPFHLLPLLERAKLSHTTARFRKGQTIFHQGAPCEGVYYIVEGRVSLSVVSKTGRVADVGELDAGDFLGAGHIPVQSGSGGADGATPS